MKWNPLKGLVAAICYTFLAPVQVPLPGLFLQQTNMETTNEYLRFLESKKHSIGNFGFDALFVPDMAFDFQRYIIGKACLKGRMAIFADTGLGKTLIQLSIAENIVRHTNGKVLILTPLAVAFQFMIEAEKIGIDSIEYSKDGKHTKKIVICNYERLHYFDSKDFQGVILDESSILKNFDGKIKNQVNSFIKKTPYRYLSTATPSPNDFIELGTSSEALGYMGYMDMLTKFFKNNQNSVDSNNRNIGEKFYLKPHAENDFFAWVNQWAIMVKMPSDIGFSNDRYNLPELIINKHVVQNQSLIDINGQFQLFTPIAKTMTEVRHEQKQTEEKRCEKAIELSSGKTSVYWCNTNNESTLLKQMDSEAVEIIGSQSIEKKEEILLAFANGEIKRLITKAKMTGMGLNWQHCNHSVFFPTWSYEQYYQAIRRFWRFGQKNDVVIDLVISDGQTRVIEALQQKTEKAMLLYQSLTQNVNRTFEQKNKEFNKQIITPKFL
jgi:SNF2 family DNA or RNA helicase